MRIFSVHDRPGSPAPDRGVLLVKEGFCWPAFFLTALWALWHRLWRAAAALLVAGAGLEAALRYSGADQATAAAGWLAFSLLAGLGGNDWRRSGLLRRGYRRLGLVAATSREAALRRFFDLHPEPPSRPAAVLGETAF